MEHRSEQRWTTKSYLRIRSVDWLPPRRHSCVGSRRVGALTARLAHAAVTGWFVTRDIGARLQFNGRDYERARQEDISLKVGGDPPALAKALFKLPT